MAWIENDRSGTFHVAFRFGGRKFKRSLETTNQRKAETRRMRLEETIGLVKTGRLEIPDTADVAQFLLSDGKLSVKPTVGDRLTLARLLERYWDSLPDDSLEPETLRVGQIHTRHLQRIIGKSRAVDSLGVDAIQDYINRRSREKSSMSRLISPTTIKKEVATLRCAWNWAMNMAIVTTPFPKKLRYPKTQEKHPFQTWSEIERRLKSANFAEHEEKALWDCLYLSLDEISALLSEILRLSHYSFLYPMAATAAYTGARHSELCRAQVADFDLKTSVFTIRETKRTRSRRTTRQVPISSPLRAIIEPWLEAKRDSTFMFPADHRVVRSRRNRQNGDGVSVDEASYHLDCTLQPTRWRVIRGWHIFRHSFCSNCASASVDQRMIDSWLGHQTEEMRKRYRHLFPNAQQSVINQLFDTA